jgi:phospholipase C
MIIASPWSRGGNVCSQVFDHTSVLQFLEDFLNKKFNKEIKQTNISEWRRTVCGNLTSVFNLYTGQHSEKLPFLARDPLIEKIYNAQFKNEPSDFRKLSALEIEQINRDPTSSPCMPQQEKGVRPACPLPYQLYVHGKLSPDKKKFELTMKAGNKVFGERSAGSPFNVYAPGLYLSRGDENTKRKTLESVRTWHYAVTAGDALTDLWPLPSFENENYHLRVYGPNGFFREFTGNNQDPSLQIECNYQHNRLFKNKLTGNVELKIKNISNYDSYQLEIEDRSYGNKAIHKKISPSEEETILLDTGRSFGWYDFIVRLKGNTFFSQRFAGRVETGKESFSDPVMGKVKI